MKKGDSLVPDLKTTENLQKQDLSLLPQVTIPQMFASIYKQKYQDLYKINNFVTGMYKVLL